MTSIKTFLKKPYSKAVILTAVFILFTIFVAFIDRRPIAPDGSLVGFGALNDWFRNIFGQSGFFEFIAKVFGVFAILLGVFWALIFILRLIKRKSLKKIDVFLWIGICFIIILALLYLAFNAIIINVRPVLENGEVESSYPSSHTLLILSVFLISAYDLKFIFKDKKILRTSRLVLKIMAAVGVIARLLSGVHWLTDIIGAIILAYALYDAYVFTVETFTHRKRAVRKS